MNNGCWGNQIGTCGFGNDEVRLELEYQFGHSLFSQRKPTFIDLGFFFFFFVVFLPWRACRW